MVQGSGAAEGSLSPSAQRLVLGQCGAVLGRDAMLELVRAQVEGDPSALFLA